jgi:hypothetical protein
MKSHVLQRCSDIAEKYINLTVMVEILNSENGKLSNEKILRR